MHSRNMTNNHESEGEIEVAQSCLTLCDSVDCSPPGSSIHGIFQARIFEWVAISFSRDLPEPGIEPWSPTVQADASLSEPPGKPHRYSQNLLRDPALPFRERSSSSISQSTGPSSPTRKTSQDTNPAPPSGETPQPRGATILRTWFFLINHTVYSPTYFYLHISLLWCCGVFLLFFLLKTFFLRSF